MRKYLLGGGLAFVLVFALVGTASAKSVFQNAPGTLQSEVQNVDLAATGGTFKLSFEGQTTTDIDFDATAGEVQTALEALSNIAPGDVGVAGPAGGSYSVTFMGTLANTDVDQMIIDDAALTGGSGAIVTTTTIGVGLHDQGLDSAVADGGNQLTARSGPLSLSGQDYLSPTRATKKAGRVRLLFDEGIELNNDKFPVCDDPASLEGTSSDDAKVICGEDSQVSIDGPANSEATAALNFGPAGLVVVNPVVTAFNGPKNASGNPTLILHTFLAGPPSNTTVLLGELTVNGSGRTLLDVDKIPPLAGGLGALTDFFSTLNAETKDKAAINKAKKKAKKAKKKYKKAKKKYKKAKKKAKKASGKKAKKLKKKAKKLKKKQKKLKKKYKKAQKQLRKAKAKRINYIEATCTGGSYETDGTWNLGRYTDNTDLNSFVTEFQITGQDSVACKSNGDTVVPFSSGR